MLRLEERIVFDGAVMFDLVAGLGEETSNDLTEGYIFPPPHTTPFEQEILERKNLIDNLDSDKQPPKKNITLSEALTAMEKTKQDKSEYSYYPTGSSMGIAWMNALKALNSKTGPLHKHPPLSPRFAVQLLKFTPTSKIPSPIS